MKILAISGSLRRGSSNTTLLRAITRLAPADVDMTLADPVDRVPHFNPDLDTDPAHPEVSRWREELRAADGVVLCSPEYAHGVPGVLKNALDWIVSSGELESKPTALVNASPNYLGASIAHASLREILSTMGAMLLDDACLSISGVRGKLGPEGEVTDDETRRELQSVVDALVARVRECHASASS